MARHVIIGGGPAGIAAIEAIRATEGQASAIALISDEPAYSRMVLPYYLAREIPEAHCLIGDQAYFDRQKVEPLLGVRVQRVDTQTRNLILSDGQTLPFDTLLIATGSSAQRPPISGVNQDGVYTFWTLDDARKTIAKGQGTPEAVLVGAGFIGFIVLNAMTKLGWKLSVVEMEPQVLPRMLDKQGANAVDEWLQTSMPGIYAAGDVAAGPDLLTGKPAVHAIQPTAIDHGRIAGANMAGKGVRYPGSLLMNVLDVIKLHCASFGLWREDG